MRKIHTVSFSKDTNNKSHRLHIRIALIIVLIIVIGGVSTLILLQKNHFNFDSFLGVRDDDTTAEESTVEDESTTAELPAGEYSDTQNFLFICCDNNKQVKFSYIFAFNPENNEISLKRIEPDFQMTVFTGIMSLNNAFGSINIDQLKAGFLNAGIPVSKYLIITEDNFVTLAQDLGIVKINLSEPYSFKVDSITYTYPVGVSEFSAEGLLNYLEGTGLSGDSEAEINEAAKTAIESYITQANIDKGEELFSTLINLFDTDITAFDYYNAKDIINSLITSGFKITTNTETEGEN